ncbi:pyrroline-5-carboxylate reductase dimerization domain-containing protein [Effusibacillus consociatus]|uniref:Pyrroline-5-carboxylate reductase dimerization domain-containing protein n=1 Tax=Effusibacillus consociatus TaxID=1117041 RepID=A0ABV9Q1J2_9BACL
MRLGFVGTGSMGGMLVRAFVRSGLPDVEVAAYNRTAWKLDRIIVENPNVRKMDSASSLAKFSDFIFLCVKPADVLTVLKEIRTSMSPDKFLISINSAWSLSELESEVSSKVIKIIPSITQEALSGVMLTMYGSRATPTDRQLFEATCRGISFPVVIKENDVRVCSDLTSCGPAFLAFVLQSFASAAVRQGGIPPQQADQLVKYMIYGLGKLFVKEGYEFEEIISRVSLPGGVTEAGLKVLKPAMEGVFDDVLTTTKHFQGQHTKDK